MVRVSTSFFWLAQKIQLKVEMLKLNSQLKYVERWYLTLTLSPCSFIISKMHHFGIITFSTECYCWEQ